MNFIEGTRFSSTKHQRQASPYELLLKPRAGGIAFVLSAMGEQLHKLVNVTIDYPGGTPTFWDFACGKVKTIGVQVKVTPIAELFEQQIFNQRYFDDPQQRAVFQQWLNALWSEKDQQLLQLRTSD